MNIIKAFNRVFYLRLLYNIREVLILEVLVKQISSFLDNRSIAIRIGGYILEIREALVEILQRSLILSILYLFYNIYLLRAYKNRRLKITIIGFINNIIVIAIRDLVKANIYILKIINEKYQAQKRSYKSKFNRDKFYLVYIARARLEGLNISIYLSEQRIDSKPYIKILRVQINQKLLG